MSGKLRPRLVDAAVPLGFGLALLLLTPWRTAYQFGGDENFELMKALLVSRGHRQYGAFWNDQPPLHTELLAGLFRLGGASAGLGRLLSIGFAMLLAASLHALVRRGVNRLAGVAAVVLLASASEVLRLSVSVMLELPAFALGLAAVGAWQRRAEGGGRGWLVLSGLLMGSALQVKFTAALLLPALAVVWWETWHRARRQRGLGAEGQKPWRDACLWLGCAGGTFGVVVLACYGPGAWGMMAASHFSAATRSADMGEFRLALLAEDGGLVFLALLGLGLQLGLRRPALWFPVVWLATALVIHAVHRPWWPYYLLHFAVPLAWLGAAGAVEGFRQIARRFPEAGGRGWAGPATAWAVWSLAVAGGLGLAMEKAVWEWQKLRSAPTAEDVETVRQLRVHAAGTRWIFTTQRQAAFWAGLPIPPELAVLPWKRRVSGQVTSTEIMAVLERYRPELVLLYESEVREFELAAYLEHRYRPAPESPDLYLRKQEGPATVEE